MKEGLISVLKKSLSLILALLASLLFWISGLKEDPPKADFYEPVYTDSYTLLDGLSRSQGVTTDGEYYYFSSNFFLIKTRLDAVTQVASNYLAIPPHLLAKGCKHIGGITYYDGKIYAPVEDSKVFENLYICVYDAKTLRFLFSKAVPLEYHENGIPWCAADPEKGLIYSAGRDHITSVNAYDAKTLEFVEKIDFEAPVHKVQGGEMYEGILYLSISRDDHAVFAINLETGAVRKAFARNLESSAEGEGMTILPGPKGTLFHVLDISSSQLVINFRHYDFDPSSIDW